MADERVESDNSYKGTIYTLKQLLNISVVHAITPIKEQYTQVQWCSMMRLGSDNSYKGTIYTEVYDGKDY